MDISSFGRNIKAIRESRGLTQQQFADSLEILQGTVSGWESRNILPRQKGVMEKICETYGVTEQDLFGFSDGFYAKQAGMSGAIAMAKPMTSTAPVVGFIHAGDACEAIEFTGDEYEVPTSVREAFPSGYILIASGDSMNLVGIVDGSGLYVVPNEDLPVKSGDIAAVKVNGDDATVKVVKLFDGVVILEPRSSNPVHKRRVIDESDPDAPEVRLLGKVVWCDYQLVKF